MHGPRRSGRARHRRMIRRPRRTGRGIKMVGRAAPSTRGSAVGGGCQAQGATKDPAPPSGAARSFQLPLSPHAAHIRRRWCLRACPPPVRRGHTAALFVAVSASLAVRGSPAAASATEPPGSAAKGVAFVPCTSAWNWAEVRGRFWLAPAGCGRTSGGGGTHRFRRFVAGRHPAAEETMDGLHRVRAYLFFLLFDRRSIRAKPSEKHIRETMCDSNMPACNFNTFARRRQFVVCCACHESQSHFLAPSCRAWRNLWHASMRGMFRTIAGVFLGRVLGARIHRHDRSRAPTSHCQLICSVLWCVAAISGRGETTAFPHFILISTPHLHFYFTTHCALALVQILHFTDLPCRPSASRAADAVPKHRSSGQSRCMWRTRVKGVVASAI